MKTEKFLFCLLAVIFAGCIPSLHPLFAPRDATTEDTLLGTWTEDGKKETWKLRPSSIEKDKQYRLILTDQYGKQGCLIVTFGRLNGLLFADLFPEQIDLNAPAFYQMHLRPVHTFVKIEQNGSELKINVMDPAKVAKLLKNNPSLIKYEVLEGHDSDIIFTASTDDLQKFVAKYANDPNVFANETILKQKPQEPNDPNSTQKKN